MGNGAGKEGSEGEVRQSAGYEGHYIGTKTNPGAPGAFSEAFATQIFSADQFHHINLSEKDIDIELINEEEDNVVPTVFRWEHGGRQVYITGTFNNWERQIPMHRSGNDFTYIHDLKKGKHAFKFIVDDEWRYAPDQPTVADIEGRINNFIDVSQFKAYVGEENFEQNRKAKLEANEQYNQIMPDMDEYTKEPPLLPPQLRTIILNKSLPDPSSLPPPQHVALNHLYCTAIKDGIVVLGMTQRHRQKFVTTVYYSTVPG
mmetsp:Transcript_18055/g.26732  ORF Transcript_18055/g.26732 Transcript_18055/m.26732 type:complete len:259 (-) Transcript_18055:59-835(-)